MNILLTSVFLKDNFGYPSIVSSLKGLWGELDPELKLTAESSDTSPAEEALRRLYGLDHADLTVLSRRKNFLKVLSMCRKAGKTRRVEGEGELAQALRRLMQFDAIVEMRGICFSDDIGGQRLYTKLFNFPLWIYGKTLKIPVVKYTTAIGPADKLSTRLSIRIYLGHFCDLALLRDEESYNICKRLRLKSKYMLVPDTAFCMPAADCAKAREVAALKGLRPVVGVSVSHQLMKRSRGYMASMTELVTEIAGRLGAKALLIPNEFSSGLKTSDRDVARSIFEAAGNPDIEIVDVDNLTPNEVKAVVAACDVMVCARYHSVVASLSSGVPALVLSWHHKYREVMRLFELEEYVVEKESGGRSVVPDFHSVYANREEIRARLRRNLPAVRESVRKGAEAFYNTVRGFADKRKELQ